MDKRDFNKDASSWDENPRRVQLAKEIAHSIRQQVRLSTTMDVLDFGCGTGLLAIELLPYVRSVTGVDSSAGMLEIFDRKIADGKLDNVHTLHFDFDRGDTLQGRYDLVLSSMTLHHVREIGPLFVYLSRILRPGGFLCLADLDLDGGKFHADNTGVFHFGFCREKLRKKFQEAGFEDIRDRDAAEVVKPASDGAVEKFGIFLMTGRKGSK